MAVFRVERNTGYTDMSNHHLRNKELSLKAKGLLSQMLSLPEDWDYTLAGLSYINREKIDAIARKNGLDYNVKKIENGKPPTYLVSFRGKDIDVMTEAFREFTAKKLGRDKKPSIRKLLSTLKDKAAALNAQRDKVKKKDREVSL